MIELNKKDNRLVDFYKQRDYDFKEMGGAGKDLNLCDIWNH